MLYVPYTCLKEATQIYLYYCKAWEHPDVEFVEVSGDRWAYIDYFQQRWDECREFVSLEHDVVPWMGAVRNLLCCPEPWCFFGYFPGVVTGMAAVLANGLAPTGLMKFSPPLIEAIPNVWVDMRARYFDKEQYPRPWAFCDTWLVGYAEERGITPHQHWPSVLNANLQPVGFLPLELPGPEPIEISGLS